MGHFSLLWRKHLHWIHTENLKQHTIIVNEECILQHYDTSKNTSTPKRLVQVWPLRNDSYFLVCSSSQEGITFPSTSISIPQLQRGVLFLMEVERLWSGHLHWSDTTRLWAYFTQICNIQTTWNHFPLLILIRHSSMSTREPCKCLCSRLWKVMLPSQDDNSLSHQCFLKQCCFQSGPDSRSSLVAYFVSRLTPCSHIRTQSRGGDSLISLKLVSVLSVKSFIYILSSDCVFIF